MTWPLWLLTAWSGAGALWWFLATVLVTRRRVSRAWPAVPGGPSLTVFKSLPPGVPPAERAALAAAIESFLVQLQPGDELLLGLPASEADLWRRHVEQWTRPEACGRVRVFPLDPPRQRRNPKVAWLETLAPQAHGELWLWSDADIVAPSGLLVQLRSALVQTGAGAVTCPYFVARAAGVPAVLDALFVNAEFLPGALLLGRRGPVDFAFGAATVFRADAFRRRGSWEQLGATLADDHVLGRQLQPVSLRGPLVETLALETTVAGALRHYYRWQKTVRWCRPGGYAALLLITPLLGWGLGAVLSPADLAVWLGLAAQVGIESVAAGVLCLVLGVRMSAGAWLALLLWPPLRALTWLAVWLPLPVRWRGEAQDWPRATP